jgi:RHS repeat-associated protein
VTLVGPEEQGSDGRAGGAGPSGPPVVSTPKGGGAIRGLGETFATNPATGTGSLTIPIPTSPGRAGFGAELALAYDSGRGSTPFGWGFDVALPAITRRTDTGVPRYRDSGADADPIVLTGAGEIVPALVRRDGGWEPDMRRRVLPDGSAWRVERYRPRAEGAFARIERWTDERAGETHWRTISRDNVTTRFGTTAESRVADPADPSRVFSWLVAERYDDRGNAMVFRYASEDSAGVDTAALHERNRTPAGRAANRYVKRILYDNRRPHRVGEDLRSRRVWLLECVFDYGDHPGEEPTPEPAGSWPARSDPISTYRSGFEIRTYRLCRRILMFHHFEQEDTGRDCLVRSTDLGYDERPAGTLLTSVTQHGYRRLEDGSYVRRSLPPVELEYSPADVHDELDELEPGSLDNLAGGVDGITRRWLDLRGEALVGVASISPTAWYFKRNLSPLAGDGARLGPLLRLPDVPIATQPEGGAQRLLDLEGDGRLELADLAATPGGFYARAADGDGWDGFRPFESLPVVDWADPNVVQLDLTGDGRADVVEARFGAYTWFPWLGGAGFGAGVRVPWAADEDAGPRLLFHDTDQVVAIADMCGNGLPALVRIRNGDVSWWPNLGHGRFGPRVAMDNAPWFDTPDAFDPARVGIADFDGSGTGDFYYEREGEVTLYFNRSGNSRSAGTRLTSLASAGAGPGIAAIDLKGNGCACLVASSPLPVDAGSSIRYVDVMGGRKPHLLVGIRNNLGAETQIEYAPSTKFYLQDEQARRPWITRLQFPVHVVERVQTHDRVSRNRFVSRYSYHHGRFDARERQFCGFARVDQLDTEELGIVEDERDSASNLEAASDVPPVLTKRWFHTGAFLGGEQLSARLAAEYHRDDEGAALLLDDTVLPIGLTSLDELREACHALTGALLREEVYALDGSEAEGRPYRVTEDNRTVVEVQPRASNRHAVFFVHEREALTVEYDRALVDAGRTRRADPRVTHALTLAVDDYGNVVRSAAIAYGRRHDDPDPGMTPRARELQRHTLMTYEERAHTNAVENDDAYRAPLPCDLRRYEIREAAPVHPPAAPLRYAEVDEAIARLADGSRDIPFEATAAPPGGPSRRLIGQTCTVFRADDLSRTLPLGALESRALLFESYRLALTPSLIGAVYRRPASGADELLVPDQPALLGREGGLVRFPPAGPDGAWWVVAGRTSLSWRDDGAPAELASALEHFFLPRRFRDPFGQVTHVRYDAYDLLVRETRDALDTRTTAEHDYRVLQPRMVVDPNGMRSAVAFDALGMVVGTALMGRAGEAEGDTLDGFDPDPDEAELAAHFDRPWDDAADLLKGATTRLLYDVHRYRRGAVHGVVGPAYGCTLARETHVSDLAAGQRSEVRQTFAYWDGFGREIQRKQQAEPGPVDGTRVTRRWTASGWTVFNNKGAPVRRYEPFFTRRHHFELDARAGVAATLLYDPIGRVIATLHPNHSYDKAVYGPWSTQRWDANDTVLDDPASDPDLARAAARLPPDVYRPTWYAQRAGGALGARERAAAERAAAHAGTPARTHLDPLGRPILEVAHHRTDDGRNEYHATLLELDVDGNRRRVIDARGRLVWTADYDVLANPIRESSMEAGTRWSLTDATGQVIRAWDSRGHATKTVYDPLRRPLEVRLRRGGSSEALVMRTVYGEGRPDAATRRLRGRVYQSFDGAGVMTHLRYDFKGNLEHSRRQLAARYKDALDWSRPPQLEDRDCETTTRYDAMDRPVEVDIDGNTIRTTYDAAGLLERVAVHLRRTNEDLQLIRSAEYNARGQRTAIEHGNGVVERLTYEDDTFRLASIFTERPGVAADCPGAPSRRRPCGVQNLHYTHDPVGNVVSVRDGAQQRIFFRNRVVNPGSDYVYDALYRLLRATGREHLGQVAGRLAAPIPPGSSDAPRTGHAQPGDGRAMGRYHESYRYDAVGNLVRVEHHTESPGGGHWIRTFDYKEPSLLGAGDSNRLTRIRTDGERSVRLRYDEHGNTLAMPGLSELTWTRRDELASSVTQVVAGEATPETTYYAYEAAGARARVVTERYAGVGGRPTRKSDRMQFGRFDVYREYDGSGRDVTLERETLDVVTPGGRLALIETRTRGTDDGPRRLARHQLTDHLGSATVELDDEARVISYEEYHPYGSTAYQATSTTIVAPKRYRFTGRERDPSGLEHHGARYYAPWLGRWASCDPGPRDVARSAYEYSSNPVRFVDPDGAAEQDTVRPRLGTYYSPANTGVSGTIAHKQINPVVSERINRLTGPFYEAQAAVPTRAGGSARAGSWWKGEIDLLIGTSGRGRHVYDLKPLGTSHEYPNQVSNYVRYAETAVSAKQ